MPKTKLTLSVDPEVVARAKRFSRDGVEAATPISQRLRGVLPDSVTRDDYRRHLADAIVT